MKKIFIIAITSAMLLANCGSTSQGEEATEIPAQSHIDSDTNPHLNVTSYRNRYEMTTRRLDSLTGFDPKFSERYAKSSKGKDIRDIRSKINRLLINDKLNEADKAQVDAWLDSLDRRINDLAID